VIVLPSALTTRIGSIETMDGVREQAGPGHAVVLTVTDAIDISRGDMIARTHNLPETVRAIDGYLCWMDAEPLVVGKSYVLGHTTRRVQAAVARVDYVVDMDTLHRHDATTMAMNDIGRVQIALAEPLLVDSYRLNSANGSFILIDPQTNNTVAAGMVRGASQQPPGRVSPGVVWQDWNISRQQRETRQGHRAAVVWLTGLPGSGKTTIARAVERQLFAASHHTMLLDGDQLRFGLNGDLGFSPADRAENIRRAGETARLFFEQGAIVLCAFVSPYAADRARVRGLIPEGGFVEVFVQADAETCRARDPKWLFARAAAGQLGGLTGLSAPYEPPTNAELTIDTTAISPEGAAALLLDHLRAAGITRLDDR
jgi:bifunctional enzyme CysN/CysC